VYMTMMRRHADALAAQAARLPPQAQRDLRRVRTGLRGGLADRATALLCRRFRRCTLLENLLFTYWFLSSPAANPATAPLPGWPAAEQPAPAKLRAR